MKQHHTIEIFTANCPLCKHITDDIQIGKCEGCSQTVYDVNKMTEDIKSKMKKYGVKAVLQLLLMVKSKWLVSQISRGYVEMNCIPN